MPPDTAPLAATTAAASATATMVGTSVPWTAAGSRRSWSSTSPESTTGPSAAATATATAAKGTRHAGERRVSASPYAVRGVDAGHAAFAPDVRRLTGDARRCVSRWLLGHGRDAAAPQLVMPAHVPQHPVSERCVDPVTKTSLSFDDRESLGSWPTSTSSPRSSGAEPHHDHDDDPRDEEPTTAWRPRAAAAPADDEVETVMAWACEVARDLEARARANDGAPLDPRCRSFLCDADFALSLFVETAMRGIAALTDTKTVTSLLMATLVFLDRLPDPARCLQSRTLRRMVFVAFYVSVKVVVDETLSISEYTGVTQCLAQSRDVVSMETRFVDLLLWRLHVPPEEFERRLACRVKRGGFT